MQATFIAGDHMAKGQLNSSHYRVLIPAKYLKLAGCEIDVQSGGTLHNPSMGLAYDTDNIDYDNIHATVLLERVATPERITKLRLAGAKRIVFTFDDHYGIIPASSPSYEYWHRNKRENYAKFLKALGMCDLVIVPSRVMRNEYRKYCRDIRYVPNYLDRMEWTMDKGTRTGPLVIGWGNQRAPGNMVDPSVARGLEKAKAKYGDQIKIYMAGMEPGWLREYFDFEHLPFVPIQDWPKIVNRFDIGLAPLATDYDEYRSCLKIVEYAALGIPYICSDRRPYMDVQFRGGIMVGDSRQGNYWLEVIQRMVEDEHYRQALAKQGPVWAEEYFMDKHVDVYDKLLWGGE